MQYEIVNEEDNSKPVLRRIKGSAGAGIRGEQKTGREY
uniref:Uncharacterized protein n=1 Tax=Setaria digitata TaxID=48799 RepID=A0A915Q5M8_9BILA